MKKLKLNFPEKIHENEWNRIVSEYKRENEDLMPHSLNLNMKNFDDYLRKINEYHYNINVPYNYVPYTTYFLQDERNEKIIGIVNIHHALNEKLSKIGHIEYKIMPGEKKYVSEMLDLSLKKCKKLGIKKVLITTSKDNKSDIEIIKTKDGILENEVLDSEKVIQRYWVNI